MKTFPAGVRTRFLPVNDEKKRGRFPLMLAQFPEAVKLSGSVGAPYKG